VAGADDATVAELGWPLDDPAAAAVAAWADKYPQVPLVRAVRAGVDPAIILTAGSRVADLVVVGASLRGRLARSTSGTLPQTLVRRAGCPVAVVPR
jgi:nucleotide-binding universal stress UspA family protein